VTFLIVVPYKYSHLRTYQHFFLTSQHRLTRLNPLKMETDVFFGTRDFFRHIVTFLIVVPYKYSHLLTYLSTFFSYKSTSTDADTETHRAYNCQHH